MRYVLWLILAVVVWGGGTVVLAASAITRVAVAEGAGGNGAEGGRQWELIAVEFGPVVGDAQVAVQDARGGVQIVRQVAGNAGTVWLPLPLVGRATLANDQWPVEIVVRAAGKELEHRRVNLELGTGGARRVAIPAGARGLARSVAWGGPVAFVEMPREEMVAAAALLFAGCDFVLLTPDMHLSEARALELIGVGVQLVVPGDTPPGGGLSSLVWQRLEARSEDGGSGTGRTVWIVPGDALRRPAVIEPGLVQVAESLGDRATLPQVQSASTAVLLVGPGAVVVVLLVRGLFRRCGVVVLATAVALAGLTAGVLGFLQWGAGGVQNVEVGAWRQAKGGDRAVGGLMLEERLVAATSLFGGGGTREAGLVGGEGGTICLPAASTEAAYWTLRNVQVVLRDGGRGMAMTGVLPARGRFTFETHRVFNAGLIPAFPQTAVERAALAASLHVAAGDGRWLENGYVYPLERGPGQEVLLEKWAATRPMRIAAGLRVWEDLRGQPGHRYFLYEQSGDVNLIDFGAP